MKRIIAIMLSAMMLFSSICFADTTTPYRQGYIEGYIKAIIGDKVQIEEYDGTLHVLPFTPNAEFIIDQTSASFVDFKPGMEVYATLQGRSINHIESYSTQNLGYIKEESKVNTGTVKNIDQNQITVELDIGGQDVFYYTPSTLVLKDNQKVNMSTLYVGDKVKMYFNDTNSNIASKIIIQGDDNITVKNMYKARLTSVDEISNKLLLSDVKVFTNGAWNDYSPMMSIDISSDIPLYVGSGKLSQSNLKYYTGQTVYLVTKDYFGSDKIEKLVVKNQYESEFTDKIEDINWYSEQMELQNNKNISFSDSTMIIKNGRLVDKYSLSEDSDVYVVADGKGSSSVADMIYVLNEDINNSNVGQNYIYSGRIDEMDRYSLKLEDFYVLNKNSWESFDKRKDFYYDEDTYIYDVDNNKQLSSEELFALNADKYKYYTYMYTDGDRVVSVFVQRRMDSLLKQRVTTGTIEQVKNEPKYGYTASIQNAKEWSDRKEEWMMRKSPLNVLLDDAMIIKGDKAIKPWDLKPGDRVYMLRDDIYGKVIIVK